MDKVTIRHSRGGREMELCASVVLVYKPSFIVSGFAVNIMFENGTYSEETDVIIIS